MSSTQDGEQGTLVQTFLETGRMPLDPTQVEAVYAIGHQFYAREDYARATDLFRLLVLCRPEESRGWFSLAACHEAIGDEEPAAKLYQIARVAPIGTDERRRATIYLVRHLVRQRALTEAREALEELAEESLGDDDEGAWLREEIAHLQSALAFAEGGA